MVAVIKMTSHAALMYEKIIPEPIRKEFFLESIIVELPSPPGALCLRWLQDKTILVISLNYDMTWE